VKKLAIVVLVALAACRHKPVTAAAAAEIEANKPGATSSRDAIARFMNAAKVEDLQAFAMIWGSEKGPAIETIDKNERDMREITMLCHLKHDSYRILSDSPGANNERKFGVELRFKGLTKAASFYAVLGPSNRWYVSHFDIEALREICARR